jgi:hypothetical protein
MSRQISWTFVLKMPPSPSSPSLLTALGKVIITGKNKVSLSKKCMLEQT